MPAGPRALKPDEWDQLNAVVSAVFRPQMFHDYPQLFNEANRANLRVVAEDGQVVCHVGMTERPATLAGCRIDVCCIGAVATYPEYRGRGFASLAFQDSCEKAAAAGIDILLISGGRGMYTRVGCRQVGNDWDFAITADAANYVKVVVGAPHLGTPVQLGGRGRVPDGATLDTLRRLYQLEVARFLRPLDDWRMAFECENGMNTASDFWGLPFAGGGALGA